MLDKIQVLLNKIKSNSFEEHLIEIMLTQGNYYVYLLNSNIDFSRELTFLEEFTQVTLESIFHQAGYTSHVYLFYSKNKNPNINLQGFSKLIKLSEDRYEIFHTHLY